MTREIIFLGTGHAMVFQSTTSAIFVRDQDTNLLIDVGGGHETFCQLHAAKIQPTSIQSIFITHHDNDHILGIVTLFRAFRKDTSIKRKIFCSKSVKLAIDAIFSHVAAYHYKELLPHLEYIIVENNSTYKINNWNLTFFELESKKVPELGVKIQFPDGKTLVHTGDEPLTNKNYSIAQNADVLIHEAFCLESQEEQFNAREKHHSTVKHVAITAQKLNAKTLCFFHMEDKTLKTRKKEYKKEASQYFKGKIFVPTDLDKLEF